MPFSGTTYMGYAERERFLLSVVSSEYNCSASNEPPMPSMMAACSRHHAAEAGCSTTASPRAVGGSGVYDHRQQNCSSLANCFTKARSMATTSLYTSSTSGSCAAVAVGATSVSDCCARNNHMRRARRRRGTRVRSGAPEGEESLPPLPAATHAASPSLHGCTSCPRRCGMCFASRSQGRTC